MHLFLKLHQLVKQRGDGLRPEWLDLMTRVMSADGDAKLPPLLTVVQPGNHPDGVPVVPPKESAQPASRDQRKAAV